MRMKFRCSLMAIMLLGSLVMANAGNGIKRSEWSFNPEITTSNLVYGEVGALGLEILRQQVLGDEHPWWYPIMGMRTVVVSHVHYSDGYYPSDMPSGLKYSDRRKYWVDGRYSDKVKEQLFDFGFPSYSIGYSVTYMSKELPLEFMTKIAYEQRGFDARMKNESDYIAFRKQMIVPEAVLKIRIGKYRTASSIFVLNIGASYDYALDAQGFHDGKETVNNGFSGILGFAWGSPEVHFQLGVDASFPFYDYFNTSYSPDGGKTHPQMKAKAKPGVCNFFIRYGF